MNREQFINSLATQLASLPEKERNELLDDYETHFAIGLQAGKTELQIASELGDPVQLAKDVLGEQEPRKKKHSEDYFRAVLVIIGLIFLNVNFVIPIALGLLGVWIGIIATSVATILTFPFSIIVFIFGQSFSVALLFFTIGMLGVGLLLAVAAWFIGKYAWMYGRKYVLWNIRVVKGRG